MSEDLIFCMLKKPKDSIMRTKEAMLGQNLKEHNKVAMYKISYKIQLSCYIVIKTNKKTMPLVVKIIEQVGMKLVKIV